MHDFIILKKIIIIKDVLLVYLKLSDYSSSFLLFCLVKKVSPISFIACRQTKSGRQMCIPRSNLFQAIKQCSSDNSMSLPPFHQIAIAEILLKRPENHKSSLYSIPIASPLACFHMPTVNNVPNSLSLSPTILK